MQKLAHESACKNSSFGFDVSSGTLSETCDDANKSSDVSACGSGGAHLFVEACCGCALLSSSCVAKVGFEVMPMPIDFEGNKHYDSQTASTPDPYPSTSSAFILHFASAFFLATYQGHSLPGAFFSPYIDLVHFSKHLLKNSSIRQIRFFIRVVFGSSSNQLE